MIPLKSLILFFTINILTSSFSHTKITETMDKQIAESIFNNWHMGESGNGYDCFKNNLSINYFNYFSHPLIGSYVGKEAYEKLISLVKEREIKPNQLKFSNIICYQQNNSFCFQFDSEGKVADGFDYKGYNIIQLEIKDQKLIGFREYFGYINPSWFK